VAENTRDIVDDILVDVTEEEGIVEIARIAAKAATTIPMVTAIPISLLYSAIAKSS